MYDMTKFTLNDMVTASAALRECAADASCVEEAARAIVTHLYELLGDANGDKACALVRLYKTVRYADLTSDLREFSDQLMGTQLLRPETKCLSLLATAGSRPEWNARGASVGHKAIPLPTEEVLERLPMVARLIRQLGIDVRRLLEVEAGFIVDCDETTYNVFYVSDALGSPYVPAQEAFVIPHGIQSVLGFGGLLPPGQLFAIIMFTTVRISAETAQMFRTVALSAKAALLPFSSRGIFAT